MMLVLSVRSGLRSLPRTSLLILTVVIAVMVHGLYTSFTLRMESAMSFDPGQARLVVVTPERGAEACEELCDETDGVAAYERIAVQDAFVGLLSTELWWYHPTSSIVLPRLSSGRLPRPGEALVPVELAETTGLAPGSVLTVFVPAAGAPLEVTIAGITDDPVWPYVLAPAQGIESDHGNVRLLVKLLPGISANDWLSEFSKHVEGDAHLLEPVRVRAQSTDSVDRLLDSLARLILMVAALGVANGVALTMTEREAQVALLRALGVPFRSIVLAHTGEAAALVITGMLWAWGISWCLSKLLPNLVGSSLPACVVQTFPTVGIVSIVASLVVSGLWYASPPLLLLRRRAF